jgi:HemY protein
VKLWTTLLFLLVAACAAAFGWQALAVDPGYVLVKLGQTSIETTLVFALAALLLAWGLLSLIWRMLRWPRAAWSRRSRRRGRERIAGGLVALAEGRYEHAWRELERASHQSGLRAPALLAAARAAHARGESARADAALDEASAIAAPAALALRARFLLEQGNADSALALLKAESRDSRLSPSSQRLLAESAMLCGDHATARDALAALARGQALLPAALSSLEARVLAAALAAAPDVDRLNALWSELTRAQRRVPEAVAAYARHAAALGQMLAAISEIEAALRREWSERLLRVYGELGEAEADTRMRHAEGWLAAQPNSAALLLTLGRLCIQCKLWGKAREYLQRGLGVEPSAALWEALGDCCAGHEGAADAARCYRNALRVARGESAESLGDGDNQRVDTRASVIEERSEHGVPRLALPRA